MWFWNETWSTKTAIQSSRRNLNSWSTICMTLWNITIRDIIISFPKLKLENLYLCLMHSLSTCWWTPTLFLFQILYPVQKLPLASEWQLDSFAVFFLKVLAQRNTLLNTNMGISSERVQMTGCRLAETWRLWGVEVLGVERVVVFKMNEWW